MGSDTDTARTIEPKGEVMSFRIAVDFDGTIVEHEFPNIGREVPRAFEWLKAWKRAGATLILWTTRSDGQKHGPVLTQAVEFCLARGVEFDAVNEGPGDREWTQSPKVYADRYVDDAAAGVPLWPSARAGGRPYLDWNVVGPAIMADLRGDP